VRAPGRADRAVLALWLLVGAIVWSGIFDLLVIRGGKQYLLDQARHELGLRPRASLDAVMRRTVHDAARTASAWAGFVVAAGLGTAVGVRRAARRDHAPPGR